LRVHLAEKYLIQLADGELPKGTAAAARAHLAECWQCRTRFAEIEEAIHEYVRLQRAVPQTDVRIPRANFRMRLSQAAAETSDRRFLHSLPAAAAIFLTVAAILFVSGGTVNAEGPKPKKGLTPGETREVRLQQLCSGPTQARVEISDDTRRQVFAAYGMDPSNASAYEVDYLITPELGGATTLRNLWPQPYTARWNAGVKDTLEHRLHQLVCQGKVDLATAQHDISTDWIGAYRKYVSEVPR
jgi:hypothetical protein